MLCNDSQIKNTIISGRLLEFWEPNHDYCIKFCFTMIIHSFRNLSYERLVASSKPVLFRMRSSASFFIFQYLLFFWRPASSFLRLLPRLPATSVFPSFFPSITCYRSKFLRKICSIQLVFLLFIFCGIFLCSSTLCNASFLTRSVQLISASFSSTAFQKFQVFLIAFRNAYVSAPCEVMLQMEHCINLFLKFKLILLVKRFFFLLILIWPWQF